jgi:hypothetical protein
MCRGSSGGLCRRKHDRLKRHPPRIGSELLAQRLYHRIHDKFRLYAATGPDLIDQRVAIDQPARKDPGVRNLLFQPDQCRGIVPVKAAASSLTTNPPMADT